MHVSNIRKSHFKSACKRIVSDADRCDKKSWSPGVFEIYRIDMSFVSPHENGRSIQCLNISMVTVVHHDSI